ncbi:RICIN domain-containing protein [Streptomyces sp. NPDC101151]|uniref:RICIN domain-containing protein n=1 Tax=Streptomyces sp. NPDC101151 TaxID=3366115 RepID=UPI003830E2AA
MRARPVRSPALRALLVLAFLATVLGLPAARAHAATSVTINGTAAGRIFDGVGAVSGGGGNSKLLYDYPEPQRSQILDYLFKPGYGAGVSLLKVEIGGDANSTDGAEPSHMHTADDQNYDRGYEWWLMEQAKARNPHIELAALAWSAPGWIGTSDVWTQNMITYLVNYVRGARDAHRLAIDYLGGWNENGWDAGWFVRLRAALDAAGFGNVRLVGADGGWDVVNDLRSDQAFRDAIDVVGAHYPCEGVSESTGDRCESPAAAQDLGKPLWASENGSQDYYANGPVMARQLNRGYVDAKLTAYLNWPLIAALPPGLPFQTTGLMVAPQPWSGQYSVGKGLWVQAHWNQFAQPGWQFLDSASGYLSGDRDIGSYVTLKAPGSTAYSTIIETTRATTTERFTANVTGGLPAEGPLHVWATDLSSDHPADWFVRQPDVTPSGGSWSLTLQPGHIYSVGTAGGQGRGTASGPAAASFPLPHSDSFDGYATGREARYLADQHGSFETVPCGGRRGGRCLRQMAPVAPVPWHPHDSPAYALIGDNSLTNYTVQSDVMFERTGGSVALLGRFGARDYWQVGRINAYHLKIAQSGRWQILRGDTAGTLTVLASGTRAALDPDTWHKVAFRLQDSTLTALVDGVTLGSAEDTAYGLGPAGVAVGVGETAVADRWRTVQFDNFSITPGPTTTYKIVNRNSGKVLASGSAAEGAAVVQQTDAGTAIQRWRVVPSGAHVQLVNVGSNRALDVPGFSTTQGTQLVQWTVNGGANQQWTLGTASDGLRTLINRNSGLLADVSGASTAQDAPVIQWAANGGPHQQWQLVPA